MEVILQEDVPSLGAAGDVVAVKEGYARNYLLPRKLAVKADPKNLAQLEHQKRVVEAIKTKAKKKMEELATKLGQLSITISKEAGEEEKLFGSVTTMDVANALRTEGYTIDRRHIKLKEPIKEIGVFEVPVHLHPEVEANVKVWVVKK